MKDSHHAPPRVAVAMLGARRHYAVPRALHAAGLLERFFTDVVNGLPGLRLSPCGPAQRLTDRRADGVPAERIRTFPLFALRRAVRGARAVTPSQRLRAYADWNREFGDLVCRHWPAPANAAYVFNAAGVEILRQAAARGVRRILDQTAAPWAVEEAVLAEERARWPGWEFEGAAPADWQPLADRESEEWRLADRIVCGSEYVRESLRAAGGPEEKCVVIPYGVRENAAPSRAAPESGPLRVLFVGTLQLRKGIQYLAEAARLLKPGTALFRAVGAPRISADAMRRVAESVDIAGPVPRSATQDQYARADVLVAPSISEGSANVCYEALTAGVPVITTPNTGSVVRDGVEGFVVPIRSAEAIADRITRLADDRALLATLADNARRRAAEFSEQRYAERLAAAVRGDTP